MKTLLVDGDNLLTIGYHGLKNYFYKGKHIGGLYHFINTLRRFFEEHNLDKIVVLWDGDDSSVQRRKIYHQYKENRQKKQKTEEEIESYNFQRNRIKQYLEELYVRQGEYEFCECDDAIAYYTQNSPNEHKLVFSSDKDLVQLISHNTDLYNPTYRQIYKLGDSMVFNHEEILVENIKIVKILCGDPSDNIYGIRNLGIKKLVGIYPEIKTRPVTIDEIRTQGEVLFQENKKNITLNNLLTGVTKLGVFGEEFFELNTKIVDLTVPFLTEDAKMGVDELIYEKLDTTGRSYKNTMKMMMEDGIFTLLPKRDGAWVYFLTPFLKLTSKEKNRIIKKKYF